MTAQKLKCSIKDFFSKCANLLHKSLMKHFIFCAVLFVIIGRSLAPTKVFLQSEIYIELLPDL